MVTGWVVAFGWIVGFDRRCARIGSQSGGWDGSRPLTCWCRGALCEDSLAWWRVRRSGLGFWMAWEVSV